MRHTRTRKQPSLAPPNVVPSGGSRHLSESGTDTNRPAKTWVRYRRCRDAVPAREGQAPPVCGSKYRYLVGSRQMVPEAALQVMLIRRPRPSGPSGILTRTPVNPTQPTQARTGIYRAACKVATSALTTCLHSPLAALHSTTWIRDHKSHLPRHNKYTSPQNQSTCPLGLPHRVPVVSPLVPRLPDSIEVAPGRGQSDLFVGTTHPPSPSPSPNAQAAGSIPFLC